MSFWDSVSQALGTDGGNSGLLPSVSNALGTDGSKNGLLNDPVSMAAAAAAAIAFTGTDLGITSGAAGATAASEGAAAASTAATSTAGSWVPAWMSMDTAVSAAKIAAPVLVNNYNNRQNLAQAKELLTLKNQTAQQQYFTGATGKTITGNPSSAGGTNYMAWGFLAVAGFLAYQHFGK